MMQNGYLTQTTEKRLMIVSGEGYPTLAESIAERLDMDLTGVELIEFPGGELYARYLESVRGADMFIVQSLCEPVNRNLMQLLIMIDAAKRASAKRIVAVIPWYAYSRQDRKTKPREPITARLVANMIAAAGAERVMTMDLHTGQIEGYFSFPVDHLTAMHTFVDYFVDQGFRDAEDAVVVAPDTGEVKVAKQLAGHLRLPWAIVNKMRDRPDSSEVTHVIGNVEGKRVDHDRRRDRHRRDPGERREAPGRRGRRRGERRRDPRRVLGRRLPQDRRIPPQGGRRDEHAALEGGRAAV